MSFSHVGMDGEKSLRLNEALQGHPRQRTVVSGWIMMRRSPSPGHHLCISLRVYHPTAAEATIVVVCIFVDDYRKDAGMEAKQGASIHAANAAWGVPHYNTASQYSHS